LGARPARRRRAPRSLRNPRRTLRPPLDILTSQVPIDKWHEVIGELTYADAILDRLVHNAHRIDLAGDSLRRTRPKSAVKD
jgi:DNA replication protein DnaC